MGTQKWVTIAFAIFFCSNGWSQSVNIYLDPASISPNSFNVTTYTAGSKPVDPLTNYNGQKLYYSCPSGWFWNYEISVRADVSSNGPFYGYALPGGFKMTIFPNSVPKGTSNGTVTLSSNDTDHEKVLIYDIPKANNVYSTLSQNIQINNSDFANLKAGTTTVTVTYQIYYTF